MAAVVRGPENAAAEFLAEPVKAKMKITFLFEQTVAKHIVIGDARGI